jgi:hypothetical protein
MLSRLNIPEIDIKAASWCMESNDYNSPSRWRPAELAMTPGRAIDRFHQDVEDWHPEIMVIVGSLPPTCAWPGYVSRTTFKGSLSSLSPMNLVCRRWSAPSGVVFHGSSTAV